MIKTRTFSLALIFALFTIAGCQSPAEKQHTAREQAADQTAEPDPKHMDPVCEMVRDDTWTDYTLHGQDTIWFCSEFCKDAFAANPGKYTQH